MEDYIHKNIQALDYRNKNLSENEKNFEKAQAGHKPLKKCFLTIIGIAITCFCSPIPVLSGALLAAIEPSELYIKNDYNFIVVGASFGIYLAALIRLTSCGYKLTSITTIAVLIIIGGIIYQFFDKSTQSEPPFGVGGAIFILGFSIALAWLGVAITAFSVAFTSICCATRYQGLGYFLSLILSGLMACVFVLILDVELKAINLIAAIAVIISSATIVQQAMRGSPKFAWITEKAVFWAAWSGTSFYEVDLTDACFDGAALPHTDFRKAILTRASFEKVTGVELSRLQGTILEQPKVRKLLITKRGCDGDYTGANFNGANLKGADLTQANLTEVQALDADFTGVILTDACIQGWNINNNTCFEGVICKRIFLKGTKKGDRLILSEQKPDSGEFKPGEFEKWISEIQNTVDLIFREGLNWRAFIFSLAQTAIEHEQLDLSRYSITRKDENLVFAKIGTLPGADNAAIHQAFKNNYEYAEKAIEAKYQLVLQAKDNEIERFKAFAEENQQILRELMSIAVGTGRQVLVQGEGHRVYMLNQTEGEVEIMEGKKETNVGGDVCGGNKGNNVSIGSVGRDMTLTGSSLAGDLNQVSNTIQQLRDVNTSSGDELAKILTALKDSIAQDQALSESQKKEALDAVETLAEEGKKQPEERVLKHCSMAVNALKGITSTVTDMSKLAEIFSAHLPSLTGLLGL